MGCDSPSPSLSLSHPIHHGERLRECPLPHTYIALTPLSSTSASTTNPLAASRSSCSTTSCQRRPKISVSSPRARTVMVTRDPGSTVSFPNSCSRAVTLPITMARAVNRSTAPSLTVRSLPKSRDRHPDLTWICRRELYAEAHQAWAALDGQLWQEHQRVAVLYHHHRHYLARRQTRRVRYVVVVHETMFIWRFTLL
jgi:hypothetical protein